MLHDGIFSAKYAIIYIQYIIPKHLLITATTFFNQPPLIQEIWYAPPPTALPPSGFFLLVGGSLISSASASGLESNQLWPSFKHPRSVPVVWRQIWRWVAKKPKCLGRNSYFKWGWIMPIGFGGYVGAISKPPLMLPCQAFSSESIFSLKPLLSPEPSVAERMEWM